MAYDQIVRDWLEGWNGRDLDRVMAHYAEDAEFQSPTVLLLSPGSDGTVRGRDAVRRLFAAGLAHFPRLRFELHDVIEKPDRIIIIHRKHNGFVERAGLTVETFDVADGLVRRNVVYWSTEEVAGRFSPR
jgi:ketosteroid isomerase-like protein